jgi:hypothetical protein
MGEAAFHADAQQLYFVFCPVCFFRAAKPRFMQMRSSCI